MELPPDAPPGEVEVLVDGQPAGFKQTSGKLLVTPPGGIKAATAFTTTVTYATAITAYTDPDGSSEGWVPSSDGAFVVNEPVGAMSWFPNNNVPTDKATYDLRVTVPGSREVIGNGKLVSNTLNASGTRTWHWAEDSPMAGVSGAVDLGDYPEHGAHQRVEPLQRVHVGRQLGLQSREHQPHEVPHGGRRVRHLQ